MEAFAAILDEEAQALSHIPETVEALRTEVAAAAAPPAAVPVAA